MPHGHIMRRAVLLAFLVTVLMLPAHPWGLALFVVGCGWQVHRHAPRPDRYLKWSR